MANRRVLVKRRKAVRNIRKITRTMQLIATARFQAAFNRAVATRPYTEKLAELVADLSRAAGDVDHPLLKTHDEVPRSALVVLTSDRGLAGGYNANVLRVALGHLEQQAAQGITTDVHMVGKKGIAYFRFLRRTLGEQTSGVGDRPRFEQVEAVANALMDRFVRGEIASAHVAYMKFLSAGQQRPTVVQLLPLKPEMAAEGEAENPISTFIRTRGLLDDVAAEQAAEIREAFVEYLRQKFADTFEEIRRAGRVSGTLENSIPVLLQGFRKNETLSSWQRRSIEYEFSPDPQQLLDELLPATVRVRLFQAFNDAAVSEQVARMVAMKAATDAAGDMIKALTREYNRARQTQITMELLDIVGGANALS